MKTNYMLGTVFGVVAAYSDPQLADYILLSAPALLQLSQIPITALNNAVFSTTQKAHDFHIAKNPDLPKQDYTKNIRENYVKSNLIHAGLVAGTTGASYGLVKLVVDNL